MMLSKWFPSIFTFGRLPFLISFSLIVIVIITGGYFAAKWSEPYQMTETAIRQSQSLKSSIGDIQLIWLRFFDGYKIRTSGPEGTAEFKFDVQGKKRNVVLSVRLERSQNVWKFKNAKFGEQTVQFGKRN